jgi:nicotinate-nucleotide adenylyltransferase
MYSTNKTGLFFGSFNPLHIGHLIIAGYMHQFTDLEEIWFVVSPHNPLKEKTQLLDDRLRLQMMKQSIEGNPSFKVTDVEFHLQQPSYTIDTLKKLQADYLRHTFVIIAGTDIFEEFHKWKGHLTLIENFPFYVYRRPGYNAGAYARHPNVQIFDAPLLEISSSFIREAIKKGKDVRYMLPAAVWEMIDKNELYQ